MAAKNKYIRIRKGRISVNDRLPTAIAVLGLVLGLHLCGLLAILMFAASYDTLNAWLISALALFVTGTVSTTSSLVAILRLSGNVKSRLLHAWSEHATGKLVSDDILSCVAPLYPQLNQAAPIFGLISAIFLAGALGMAAIGIFSAAHAEIAAMVSFIG